MIPNSRALTRNTSLGSEAPASTQAATAYSDRLMDDLFLDVDQILDGDLSSTITVAKHPPRSLNSATHTIQLPAGFVPKSPADIYRATIAASHRQSTGYSSGRPVTSVRGTSGATMQLEALQGTATATKTAGAVYAPRSEQTALAPIQSASNYLYPNESLPGTALARISPQREQATIQAQRQVSLPFLLIGAASIAATSIVGLSAIAQSVTNGNGLLSLNGQVSMAAIPSSDRAFLNYLQHSLEVISAGEAKANGTNAALPALPTVATPNSTSPPTGTLPSLPTTATTTNVKAPDAVERVFVPVYQNGQNAQTGTPLPSAVTPRGQRSIISVPVAASPLPTRAPAPPAASLPVLPGSGSLPSVPAAVAPSNSATSALTDVTPAADLALVGVLNLGSQSAALFNIDGSSQRAYVGDRVGVSGWTLVSINTQDVVVRRDGEVRSIYIGQTF